MKKKHVTPLLSETSFGTITIQKNNYLMSKFEPVVQLSTYSIPFCLFIWSFYYMHVSLTPIYHKMPQKFLLIPQLHLYWTNHQWVDLWQPNQNSFSKNIDHHVSHMINNIHNNWFGILQLNYYKMQQVWLIMIRLNYCFFINTKTSISHNCISFGWLTNDDRSRSKKFKYQVNMCHNE